MKVSCKEIEEMLVDYADGQLSLGDAREVTGHLTQCKRCQNTLKALQRSLELADIIWEDGLEQLKDVRVSISQKTIQIHWPRYAAIAACILLATTSAIVWHALSKTAEKELTFAEMEQKIEEAEGAARLLAAVELLSKYPDAQDFVKRQYYYIVETYPETPAAVEVKSRMQ